MAKETVEEAAIEYSIDHTLIGFELSLQKAFLAGANWQAERSYTEEEVYDIISKTVNQLQLHFSSNLKDQIIDELFRQFKK